MKLILPTSFLPPVSYIARILHADEVYIETSETFPKQTLRNRYEILTSQGRFRLSVPLSGRSNSSRTSEIRVMPDDTWRTTHWRSIVTAYGSAPYFMHYEQMFRSMLFYKTEKLTEYNMHALEMVMQILKIKMQFHFTTEYVSNYKDEQDLRTYTIDQHLPRYIQVFEEKTGFASDLSILDLIFNSGPSSLTYLTNLHERNTDL